jgi:hypothetical protein
LITSGIYFAVTNTWSLGVTTLFGLVSLLNGLWVYIFNISTVRTNNICVVIVILMAICN